MQTATKEPAEKGPPSKPTMAKAPTIAPVRVPAGKRQSALTRLLSNIKNPLVLLLIALGVLSFLTGDVRATVVISVMVVLDAVLRFFQEMRADNAAAKLQAMVSNTATLVRDGKDAEVALKMLVPGDIIRLTTGDMVPADARVLSSPAPFRSALQRIRSFLARFLGCAG